MDRRDMEVKQQLEQLHQLKKSLCEMDEEKEHYRKKFEKLDVEFKEYIEYNDEFKKKQIEEIQQIKDSMEQMIDTKEHYRKEFENLKDYFKRDVENSDELNKKQFEEIHQLKDLLDQMSEEKEHYRLFFQQLLQEHSCHQTINAIKKQLDAKIKSHDEIAIQLNRKR